MRNIISVTAPLLLSRCVSPILQAQIHNHNAMQADTVTVTSVPDLPVQRVALLNMTPMAGGDDLAVIMKQCTRARLGVDGSQLLPLVAVWYASDKAATDSYDAQQSQPILRTGLAARWQRSNNNWTETEERLSRSFSANLASLGGSGIQNLNAYLQRLKQYTLP